MKLSRTLASTAVAALALGGVLTGATSALAAPPTANYVPVADILLPQDAAEEAAVYNQWHFDPDHKTGATQAPNGLLVTAGGDVLPMLGNGNDIAKTDPAARPDPTTVTQLAASLSVVSSDDTMVNFQIPVFYDYNVGSGWKYTTLRKAASDSSNMWLSSSSIADPAIPGMFLVGANTPTDIAVIAAALDASQADSRPIGAGFLVMNSASDVLVSAFTANGETVRFYDQPVADAVKSASEEFVLSSGIRPDESTYPGWHQGASGAGVGTYSSLVENGATKGLNVTGRSQILNGYADEDFTNNNLPEILAAGVSVVSDPADDAVGYTFQVPIFFYVDGVIGQQYTTLRTDVPAGGAVTAAATWTTSGVIGSSYDRGDSDTLDNLLGAISSYQIIGHGIYVEAGSALVQSVTFNGLTTNFAKAAPAPAPKPAGPQQIANTGAGDFAPMVGIAAVALLVAGGALLAARRIRQG